MTSTRVFWEFEELTPPNLFSFETEMVTDFFSCYLYKLASVGPPFFKRQRKVPSYVVTRSDTSSFLVNPHAHKAELLVGEWNCMRHE